MTRLEELMLTLWGKGIAPYDIARELSNGGYDVDEELVQNTVEAEGLYDSRRLSEV